MHSGVPFFCLLVFLPVLAGFTGHSGTQGIEGHVYKVSGNQMPSPDRPPAKPRGIQTILYIYTLTNKTDVVPGPPQEPFYKAIRTRLVKKVRTNTNGYFKVSLPPGTYSLFVKKDSLYFANVFDGHDNIFPVEVKPGQFSKTDFTINYDASY